MVFDSQASKESMVHKRSDIARTCLHKWKPILTNCSIPIRAKLHVLKSIVVPTMTYGAALYGMASQLVQQHHNIVKDGLCWSVGLSTKCNIVSMETLRRELDFPHIAALAAGARAKAFCKYKQLATWIKCALYESTQSKMSYLGEWDYLVAESVWA